MADEQQRDEGPTKGTYSAAALPVSRRYVYPPSRNRLWWIGLALVVVLGGGLLTSLTVGGGVLVSSGPLSSSHAVIGEDCVACHTPFTQEVGEKCSLCHEGGGDPLGEYSFDAHFVYVSGDHTRAVPHDGETTCAGCHTEHRGRETPLTAVDDTGCIACHEFTGVSGHPEFDFVADQLPDDSGLAFTHIRHVDRVMEDRGTGDLEASCLACHTPTADAGRFEPIAFESHCAGCHLGQDVESAEVPIQPAGVPLVAAGGAVTLGVETLETVRDRQAPGERWALDMSAVQFDQDDGYLVKLGLSHEDPWVLHNLRRIRRAIYPSGGLADLLTMSAAVRPEDEAVLYDEALGTLRVYADGLRGRPEEWVQAELLEVDRQIAALEARLADRSTSLNDARFRLNRLNPILDDAGLEALAGFAEELAEPCLACHTLTRAIVDRVRPEQNLLTRARFDHGAHVLQRGCLDCHSTIPFEEHLGGDGPVDPALDSAVIQNLPAIDECRACHTPDLASERCLTCHDFHPDAAVRSRLLR